MWAVKRLRYERKRERERKSEKTNQKRVIVGGEEGRELMHLFVAIFVYCFFYYFLFVLVRCGLLPAGSLLQCVKHMHMCACVCVYVCFCMFGRAPLWGAKHNASPTPAWAVIQQRGKERVKHRQLIYRKAEKCAWKRDGNVGTTLSQVVCACAQMMVAFAAVVCLFPPSPPQLRTSATHTDVYTLAQTHRHTHVRNRSRTHKTWSMRWRLRVIIEEEQWLTHKSRACKGCDRDSAQQQQQCKISLIVWTAKFSIDNYYKLIREICRCKHIQKTIILGNKFLLVKCLQQQQQLFISAYTHVRTNTLHTCTLDATDTRALCLLFQQLIK